MYSFPELVVIGVKLGTIVGCAVLVAQSVWSALDTAMRWMRSRFFPAKSSAIINVRTKWTSLGKGNGILVTHAKDGKLLFSYSVDETDTEALRDMFSKHLKDGNHG